MSQPDTERSIWISRHVLPHEPALRRYLARQKLPAFLDQDDVVQEVYGRLAEMASVDAVRDPRSFLLGMTRNILLVHLRRSRIVPIQSAEITHCDARSEDPSPEEQVSDREQLHLLALAIGKLTEPWRSAFTLRVIEGLSHKEIGERLGMSENAVQKSNAKAIARLANLLGRGGSDRSRATPSRPQGAGESEDGRA